MSYTIIKSSGGTLTTIQDGTVNTTSTSLGLAGRNYSGYGQILNTNFVRLLESFADDAPPPNPLRGQLWFDTNTGTLNVCPSDGAVASAWSTLSTSSATGDATFGSITMSGNITGANNVSVTNGIVGSSVTTTNARVNGTANIATANITTATIGTLKTAIINAGTSNTATGIVSGRWSFDGGATTANTVNVTGRVVASSFYYANGVQLVSSASSYGNTQVAAYLPTHTGNVKANVVQSNTLTGNLSGGGSISGTWLLNTGSKIESTYADLGERYRSDADYPVGTLVEFGGNAEITAVKTEMSEVVFGVITESAGYILNTKQYTELNPAKYPVVALMGRVPVRVLGKVQRNDRIVSLGNGIGRAVNDNDNIVTSFNVIGRALEAKETTDEGLVECFVKAVV